MAIFIAVAFFLWVFGFWCPGFLWVFCFFRAPVFFCVGFFVLRIPGFSGAVFVAGGVYFSLRIQVFSGARVFLLLLDVFVAFTRVILYNYKFIQNYPIYLCAYFE